MKDEFLALDTSKNDFNITGVSRLQTLQGMVVQQSDKSIKIQKGANLSESIAFKAEDAPELPDPPKLNQPMQTRILLISRDSFSEMMMSSIPSRSISLREISDSSS